MVINILDFFIGILYSNCQKFKQNDVVESRIAFV